MGHEAKENEAAREALRQELVGTVLRFAVHDGTGCPKCGVQPEAFVKKFCPGYDERRGKENKCLVLGEHMHCACRQCERLWIEQPKDADDEGNTRASLLGARPQIPARAGEA